MMAQLFGSNLQVVVWVTTLSLAGFSGYKSINNGQTFEGGFFLAPPVAALILMVIFGVYFTVKRAIQKKDYDMSEFE